MIKTLRKKFVLVNMLLVTIIIVAVFATVGGISIAATRRGSQQSLHMFINVFGSDQPQLFQLEPGRNNAGRDYFLSDLGTAFVIEYYSGYLVVQGLVEQEIDAQAIYEAAIAMEQDEGVLKEFNLRYLRMTSFGTTKIAFSDYASEQAAVRKTLLYCVGYALLAIGLFFIMSLFLSNWALRPVEKAWKQQRRFLSDASHELKTPLTVILANLNILSGKGDQTVVSQEKWLQNTEYEALRMKTMVEQMLFLAKSDEDRVERIMEQVNMTALVEEAVLSFEAVAFEAGVSMESELVSGISLEGNGEELRRLVDILLDNAVKYSNGVKQVGVKLSQSGDELTLLVENSAQEISDQQLEQMFDRFYRAETSRSAPGYGLGLPIGRTIAEAHGGKITAKYQSGMMQIEVTLRGK